MKYQEFNKLGNYFYERKEKKEIMYIPKIWNTYIGYRDFEEIDNAIIKVNKYGFFDKVINRIKENQDQEENRLNLKDSQIYCAMPRYTTAWDINYDNTLSNGTIIRMLILLPMLKSMGVNILYLLPITQYSRKNKKGDIGSPFAIKDFYHIDPNLHDPIVDDIKGFNLDKEFMALIQASHYMGIRIVIDFIPRVTARDSSIIKEHPEWVYWIQKEYEKEFQVPEIPGLNFFQECTEDNLQIIYEADSTKRHINKFTLPPNEWNPTLWEEILKESKEKNLDLLELIESRMGITTPPAHSDWINDVQPIWTDITFWKLFMDNNVQAQQYVQEGQVPYVMYDTIKANKFPAQVPNIELWNMFEEVLEHYTREFDIDGFRFDIGHTLPKELLEKLFSIVKKYKPDAIFISEDLFNRNHENAFKAGYNIMLGSSWLEVANITKQSYSNFIKELSGIKIHAYACAETHDTPRIVTRDGGVCLAKSLAIVNNFLPNGIHFMLSGYEVNERQPMNCGLADNTGGADIKKAFFNNIYIEWNNDHADDMLEYLVKINRLRIKYRELIHPQSFQLIETNLNIIILSYSKMNLLILFNLDFEQEIYFELDTIIRDYGRFYVEIRSDMDDMERNIKNNILRLAPAGCVFLKKKDNNYEEE